MNSTKRLISFFLIFLSITAVAQNKVSRRIMELGKTDNRTMQHLDILTNRIGGRPTGSDAYTTATYWVAGLLRQWGLEVEIQEAGEVPVGFNRGPWSGRALGTQNMSLEFVTPSYTAGTKGLQRGHVVIEPRSRQELERMKGTLKGAWVLIEGKNDGFPVDFSAHGDSLRTAVIKHNAETKTDTMMNKLPALFYKEMKAAGILGIIQSAPVPLVAVYDRKNLMKMSFDNLPDLPDIKLNEEQYQAIRQKVEKREFVMLEFDIRNHFKPGPVKYHNVIGKIKGVKYPDEYVMTGCHLDSHDAATGAVDCGTGVAPNLEMARMIMAAGGNRPDRTILFCFWAGEEYGFLGSKYWVEHNRDKLPRITNYFNRDGGPTAASGLVVPEKIMEDIKKCTEGLENYDSRIPFRVDTSKIHPVEIPLKTGYTDESYFAMNGVPTLQFKNSDPLGYNFSYREIWHTNRDLYNMSIPGYMDYTSVTQAVTVYNMANLKSLLPRNEIYIQKKEKGK